MLRSLYINNIAIISQLELELHAGMTALTGETGAGKSIIIDSLALALGARADQSIIKQGQDKAQVIAEFDLTHNQAAKQWCEENDIEVAEQQCLLRRQLSATRSSKAYINDRPVTTGLLKQLGELLVNICGQQEHLSLSDPNKRLNIIDTHAGNQTLLAQVQQHYQQLDALKKQIAALQNTDPVDSDHIEMLKFLINELEQDNYDADVYTELDQSQRRNAHTTDIANAINLSLNELKEAEQNNALDLINEAAKRLDALGKYEPDLGQATESLNQAAIACEEAITTLSSLGNKIEFEPATIDEIEARLQTFHDLARKHRCEPYELADKKLQLANKLATIEQHDEQLIKLKAEQANLENAYQALAEKLSKHRTKAAKQLTSNINQHLSQLNLASAEFEIQCQTDSKRLSPSGQDKIEFLVSTNKGQHKGPIDKIASGGELSRLSLAIQLEIRSSDDNVLVFDEVDAGISGGTADIVGAKLKSLSQDNQLICITHLPQVASKAQQQLKISKSSQEPMVALNYLDSEQRIQELARFLSGQKITPASLANAKAMLEES